MTDSIPKIYNLETQNDLLLSVRSRSAKNKPSVEEAAQDFESLLINQMIESMWQTVPKAGLFKAGPEGDYFYELLHEQISKTIAEGEGLGIKQVLAEDMEKQEKANQEKKIQEKSSKL
jgi:peptidoglycan hydrolase FlgJ